jgi:hypothetical protein
MAYPKKTALAAPAIEAVNASGIPVVKHQEKKDKGPQTRVYVIDSGGGIVFRIPQNEISIYDKEVGYNRAIRYCPNERSIFVDQQSANAVKSDVVFRDSMLAVTPEKPNLAAFLDAHPDNRANGGSIFRLLDSERKIEVELDSEFLVHDAVAMVREKSIDELIPVALSLGLDTNRNVKEIRYDLLREAKARPRQFIELFDNPIVKTRSVVMQAVDFQILNSKKDGMFWFDSNSLIVSTPAGLDSVEIMTQFCMTDKGLPVFEKLKEELSRLG